MRRTSPARRAADAGHTMMFVGGLVLGVTVWAVGGYLAQQGNPLGFALIFGGPVLLIIFGWLLVAYAERWATDAAPVPGGR